MVDDIASPSPQQLLALRRRARRSRRLALARKFGAVLALLAVPALAAETAFEPELTQAPRLGIQPMGFEVPGQSFPGSAFYYLDETPAPAHDFTPREPASKPLQLASALPAEIGPPAAALVVRGSGSDIVRAQECLATAIYYEAASESDAGQRAVAQVVLNRVAHSAWPNTVCGVVYQGSTRSTGCQFTFTCDGSLARRPSRGGWERASRIAGAALAGSVYEPVGLSTHYHTLDVHPYWAPSLDRTTVVGAHVFYRWPGAAGERAAFAFNYAGGEPRPGLVAAAASGSPHLSDQPAAEPVPAEPAAASVPAPVASAALPASDAYMTRSGEVRSEYANSGRWIERP